MAEVPQAIAEVMKKAGVVWISVPGRAHAELAWLHWDGAGAYVVTGPGEQPLTGLSGAETCTVTARSADHGGDAVSWQATVERVEPGSDSWDAVVPAMVTARLNSRSDPDRWATDCTLLRLTPTGELTPVPAESPAAAPIPTPATTPYRMPSNIGRRFTRKRKQQR